MSYLVLARKWRPQAFADVVGQQSVVRTLQNGLLRDRVAHAMIFSGVRGVGKTTLARIMAKALNCQAEVAERPCNQCESCREITAGAAIDLQEIDGASNRGIQEIRELKENIRFFPVKNPFKVVIIDEVHMLTTEAFNALLKTLEEPPEHVYFMFATTELHKVPITILSRCQRYELKRVSFAGLKAFFEKIAKDEGVDISDKALELISREADGSVRDGLSLLDQVFSFGGDRVTDEDVVQVLGLVDRKIFSNIARALLDGNLALCFELLEKTYGAGLDLKRFAAELLDYFRSLLVCRTSKDPASLLDMSDREFAELQELAENRSRETLSLLFQLLFQSMTEMQYSAHPRLVLEMAFIKAIQAGQITPVSSLLARLDELIRQGGGLVTLPPASPGANKAAVRQEPAAPETSTRPAVEVKPPEPPREKKEEKTPVKPVEKSSGKFVANPVEKEQVQQAEPQPQEEKDQAVAIRTLSRDVRKNWDDFIAYIKDRKAWMAQVLRLCENPREEGKELVIRFDNPSDYVLLQKKENLKFLTEYAQDFFQKEFLVQIGTSREKESGDAAEQSGPREERRALANDPLVQMTAEIFGGQVAAIRTGPRFR